MVEALDVQEVAPDAFQRLRLKPERAIEELIWNSLDADAERVVVELTRSELGAVTEVAVADDGDGMSAELVREQFRKLGGSWKAAAQATRTNRRLHGREGRGRWGVFGLGRFVRWESTPRANSETITVRGDASTPSHFELDVQARSSDEIGTRVLVSSVYDVEGDVLDAAKLRDVLGRKLALYLTKYPAQVVIDGQEVDVAGNIRHHVADISLGSFSGTPAWLDIIEWKTRVVRQLVLCDEGGFALEETPPGIQAPGFKWFTAYVRWDPFRGLHEDVHELLPAHPLAQAVVDRAKERLRDYFRERALARRRETLDDLKSRGLYPYASAPSSAVERAERDVFDIILLEVSDSIPKDQKQAALTIDLMKEALERDPASLTRVVSKVAELSDELEEFDRLLSRTTLTNVITAARAVVDRLDFVAGLELLVFDPVSKRQLKERSQLHRMLAAETWIFGEEYAKVVDDESLTNVLRAHLSAFDRTDLAADISDDVLRDRGQAGIVDLMLSCRVPTATDLRRHLVVELKRPSTKIGLKEVTQVLEYATAVSADERFRADFEHGRVEWDFIVVSNDMTDAAREQAHQGDRAPGIVWVSKNLNARARVVTWGEVIDAASHRMRFMQERLNATIGRPDAVEYLRRRHEAYLPPVLADGQP